MSVINYDKPVADFIERLNATGHVTHESFDKTSVTIHHNAGNLSFNSLLNVWTTRRASAHFDVDASGAVAQFVNVNEYAWAVGNTAGNESTISIEMADASLAPNWVVAEATWKSAARLAAWLFANVVKGRPRPTAANLLPHRHWSSTDCPGPWVLAHFNDILVEAQIQYDNFTKGSSHNPPPPPAKKSVTELAREVIAGEWGNGPDRVHRLLQAGYDPNAVQVEVNRIMRGTSSAPKSVGEIANEVIAGKWGNGAERVSRLKAAGYDPAAVQREVNLRLS